MPNSKFFNDQGLPTQLPTTTKMRSDQIQTMLKGPMQPKVEEEKERLDFKPGVDDAMYYRNGTKYLKPEGTNKNHPSYTFKSQYDYIRQKYDSNNIQKGENLLYWQEPILHSDKLG